MQDPRWEAIPGIEVTMRVLVFRLPEEAADSISEEILRALKRKPNLVLGLATGSTPLPVYRRLAQAHAEHGVDFSRVQTFNLDEYVDLPETHSQSYRYFMREHLFRDVNIPPENIHFPPSEGSDLTRRAGEYEELIHASGGIDIQILGIGTNGHIGFNEPTSSLSSRTRIKTLTDRTVRDNSRFYGPGEEPPQLAATMGIGTILGARRIFIQAFGAEKAEAVRAAIEGPVSALCPASALQLHESVWFYLDDPSASALSLRAYYQRVLENDRRMEARE
jgi:glucosamine-6-phosphate deaminase